MVGFGLTEELGVFEEAIFDFMSKEQTGKVSL